MKVPFYDLGRLHDSIRGELDADFDRVVRSSAFVNGPEVSAFEDDFAAAHQTAAAAGCGSGTDTLVLALLAVGIGAGDEVVVPSMTFVATAEAVVHTGATPVVADVDPQTLLLSPATVAAVRTPATRAVLPVHLYGHAVPFDHLQHWRDEGLLVVEDAAQAHLATWHDRPVGSVGHAASFSFYPGKNLGALGDGGAVISSDPAVIEEVARIRDHGRTTKYLHEVPGYCSRLDGVQAAMLRTKLRHLAGWNDRRRQLAERYREQLPDGVLVPWEDGAVHHLLVARVDHRDDVQAALAADGIGTGQHYPVALSQQPWLRRAGAVATPHAERAADEILSLPMDPLLDPAAVEVVATQLVAAIDRFR